MLALARASMFGTLGDYADTLRNNETAAREHLLAFLNSSWLTEADDWIVVTTNEPGYGISMNRDAKVVAISAEAYKLLDAAANNIGGTYTRLDPRLQSPDVTRRIALRNEIGDGRVTAFLGTCPQVREMTQAYVNKLAAKAAANETPPPPNTQRYPNWRIWVAVGGAALLLGGGAYFAYRRPRRSQLRSTPIPR